MSDSTGNGKGATRSWWAAQWMQALSRWFDPDRLARGSNLARQGRVADVAVQVGLVQAKVQGVDGVEQDVRIEVRAFSDDQWRRIITALANQAMYTAQLLNGEMPHEIDSVFRSAGVSLFPRSAAELAPDCTCSDWVGPCVHVVAVFYRLGEMLDADPFTMLELRGRSREQVMADLRAERAERLGNGSTARVREPDDEVVPLDTDPDGFWRMGEAVDRLQIHVERPEIALELVRILGAPEFVNDAQLVAALEQVYGRVTDRALRTAYAGETPDDVGLNGHESSFPPIVTGQNGQEEDLA